METARSIRRSLSQRLSWANSGHNKDGDKDGDEDGDIDQEEEDFPNIQNQPVVSNILKKTRKNHRGSTRGSISADTPTCFESGTIYSVLDENHQLPDSSELDTTPRKKKQLRMISQPQPPAKASGTFEDTSINVLPSSFLRLLNDLRAPIVPGSRDDSSALIFPRHQNVSTAPVIPARRLPPALPTFPVSSNIEPSFHVPSGMIGRSFKSLSTHKRQGSESSTEVPLSPRNGRFQDNIDGPNLQPRRQSRRQRRLARHSSLSKTDSDNDRPKKTLNVDSPSFTPAAIPATNKASSITSQAVNAAPFTPRKLASGSATPTPQLDPGIPQFNPTSREFTQTYDPSQNVSTTLNSI